MLQLQSMLIQFHHQQCYRMFDYTSTFLVLLNHFCFYYFRLVITSIAPDLADYSVKPEITSSHSDGENHRQLFVDNNSGRQNRGLSLVVTATSTVTSYSFSTTTIKKTIILSGPNALSCLPVGYAVC